MLTDKMIKECIDINPERLKSETSLHISYGTDKNFIYGVGISIASILLNNKETHFHFHVFTDVLSEENEALFRALLLNTQSKLTFYIIDQYEFNQLPLPSKAWSPAIYYRLLIISFLSREIDNLLYLDADIICKGSLDGLKKLEFNDDIYVYAVKDKFHTEKDQLPIGKAKYFNSGFLYLSTKRLMLNNIPEKVISLVKENNFTHPDQDALNILLNDKVSNISDKYNYIFSLDWYINGSIKEENRITEDVVFIHFVGLSKPFHNWISGYQELKYFDQPRAASPWKSVPLLAPRGYKQVSRQKSHYFYHKKYKLGFLSLLHYLKLKFIK